MESMTEYELAEVLKTIPIGSNVFVSYLAGRYPTKRAIREASESAAAGINKRHFVGRLHSFRRTRRGELIFIIQCENRFNEETGDPWAFRAFNPSLGHLLSLQEM